MRDPVVTFDKVIAKKGSVQTLWWVIKIDGVRSQAIFADMVSARTAYKDFVTPARIKR